MAAEKKVTSEKSNKNIVHEQAILVETIKKELREQKLYENFSINPFTKRRKIIFYIFLIKNKIYKK